MVKSVECRQCERKMLYRTIIAVVSIIVLREAVPLALWGVW